MQFPKPFFKLIVFIILLFIGKVVLADNSPIALLQYVVNKMTVYLRQHQTALKKKLQLLNRIVYQELFPTIGLDRMVELVVDRLYWKSTSHLLQGKRFIREFEKLVISAYSSTISFYDSDRLRFYPERRNWNAALQMTVTKIV